MKSQLYLSTWILCVFSRLSVNYVTELALAAQANIVLRLIAGVRIRFNDGDHAKNNQI